MAVIHLNGKEIEAKDGEYILDVAKENGIDIPTFCYYPGLSRVGSCRMCLIEVEGQGKLQPSCVTPVIHGMKVVTDSSRVIKARASMLSFLLGNHALDCPVCDKAGECELQDQVMEYGPNKGIHSEEKYSFHIDDYELSPAIVKNSNRCVQCTRCVRVCDEVVGRSVLGQVGRGTHQEETSFNKNALDCDQCGMCIEVCPTGCFMRTPYRYEARPWDLEKASTICNYCGTGCSMTIEKRGDKVERCVAEHGTGLNGELLCARGRFGYDFVDSEFRLTTPMVRKNGELEDATWDEAFEVIKEKMLNAKGDKAGLVASSRLTNEELYLSQKLAREVLETSNIDTGSKWDGSDAASFITALNVNEKATSLEDALTSDVVIVLSSQISDETPVTDYIVRRAKGVSKTMHLIVAGTREMKLDQDANVVVKYSAGHTGTFLNGLKDSLTTDSINIDSASNINSEAIKDITTRIKTGESVSLLFGTDAIRLKEGLNELNAFKEALIKENKAVKILPLLDRCNIRGAWDMGVNPVFTSGYKKAEKQGLGVLGMIESASKGTLNSMYVIGEDLVNDCLDAKLTKVALTKLDFLLVQDVFLTDTAKLADVVLPGATFAEKNGTFTNQEGRVQKINRLMDPLGDSKTDLNIISKVASLFDDSFTEGCSTTVFKEIKANVSHYKDVDVKGELGSDLTGSVEEAHNAPVFDSKSNDQKGMKLVTGNHLFHSGLQTLRVKLLMELSSDPFVEISLEDAKELNITDGDNVHIKNNSGEVTLPALVKKGAKGSVFIPENFAVVNRFYEGGDNMPSVTLTKKD